MDDKHPQEDDPSVTSHGGSGVSVSRRRFTRAGLSGSVVLGSLVSKPVLGSQMNHCTVSGQASGNLSRLDDNVTCGSGSPPSVWLGANSWSPLLKGDDPTDDCKFNGNLVRGTVFNGYIPAAASGVPPLASIFFRKQTGEGNAKACSVVLPEIGLIEPATMLQVLKSMGTSTGTDFYLGGVVVASLLNAARLGSGYPVTQHTIIAMFNAIVGGGPYYPVDGTQLVFWDRARVIQYLSSLFTQASP